MDDARCCLANVTNNPACMTMVVMVVMVRLRVGLMMRRRRNNRRLAVRFATATERCAKNNAYYCKNTSPFHHGSLFYCYTRSRTKSRFFNPIPFLRDLGCRFAKQPGHMCLLYCQ